MLFADFMVQCMFWWIVMIVVITHLCKKVAGSNSEVASALKGAATKKAIGLVGRLLK